MARAVEGLLAVRGAGHLPGRGDPLDAVAPDEDVHPAQAPPPAQGGHVEAVPQPDHPPTLRGPRSSTARRAAGSPRHPPQGEHGGDDVGLPARLPVERVAEALEDRGLHLAALAAHPRDVGRQAVQVQRLPPAGERHEPLGALPVPVAGVLGQQLLLQNRDARAVPPLVEGRAPLHGREGGPALRVDQVRAAEGLRHVVDDLEGAARGRGLPRRQRLHLRHQAVALGVGQHHLHPETGEQPDHPLGHGERLAVGGGVGPAHGDLHPAQLLQAAEAVRPGAGRRPWTGSGGRGRTAG